MRRSYARLRVNALWNPEFSLLRTPPNFVLASVSGSVRQDAGSDKVWALAVCALAGTCPVVSVLGLGAVELASL